MIKVSEFSAWSSQVLSRALRACLAAAGAPLDLVQLAPGYAEAGKALVEQSDQVPWQDAIRMKGTIVYG